MRKPAVVEGEPISLEELARLGKISPQRASELVEIARELVASRSGGNGHSKAPGKAAPKRAARKTSER